MQYPLAKQGGMYTVESGTNEIYKNAFAGSSLTGIEMGDDIVKIGSNAFGGCRKLISIRLSNKLKVIGNKAFANSEKLETVRILGTDTTIAPDAFKNSVTSGTKAMKIYCVPGSKVESQLQQYQADCGYEIYPLNNMPALLDKSVIDDKQGAPPVEDDTQVTPSEEGSQLPLN